MITNTPLARTTRTSEALELATVHSPVGPLTIGAHRGALVVVAFEEHAEAALRKLERRSGLSADAALGSGEFVRSVKSAFARYFDGDLGALDRIPVRPAGTLFQIAVWTALREIASGSTESYAGIARRVGAPRAVRAVGAANGANPIAIVVPCHRVIGADGTLTGYGGGLDRKRWLLAHEDRGRRAPPTELNPRVCLASP